MQPSGPGRGRSALAAGARGSQRWPCWKPAPRAAPRGDGSAGRAASRRPGQPAERFGHARARLCARAGVRRPSTPGHVPPRPRAPPRTESRSPSAPDAEVGVQTAADLAPEAPRRWVAVPPPPLAVVSAPTPQPCHRSRRPKRLLGSCCLSPATHSHHALLHAHTLAFATDSTGYSVAATTQ